MVPHFKDEYWLSVGYGLEQQAESSGLALKFHEASGYRALDQQIAKLTACADSGAKAILIGAVSSDHPDLLAAIARVAAHTPVFGLVNELHAPQLTGTVGVDWRDMGQAVGAALAARFPASEGPRKAVLITGPPEAGWVGPLDSGLRAGLHGSGVQVVAVYGDDTGPRQQFARVAQAFAAHPDIEVLIGSAPAIEAAMGYLANHPHGQRPLLVATYVTHSVRRGLTDGVIAFAPFDDPVEQGRIAVRMVSDHLQGKATAGFAGPSIRLIAAGQAASADLSLSPADFFPGIE